MKMYFKDAYLCYENLQHTELEFSVLKDISA
jgi:hypothetical protein